MKDWIQKSLKVQKYINGILSRLPRNPERQIKILNPEPMCPMIVDPPGTLIIIPVQNGDVILWEKQTTGKWWAKSLNPEGLIEYFKETKQ